MKTIKIKEKEYYLRVTTRSEIEMEKKLGSNPINVFMAIQDNRIPALGDLLIILHGCLVPLNSGISLEDTYDMYDQYIEEGHNIVDLIKIIVDTFEDSGFIKTGKN